ncbi:MAG: hypothetical protein M3P85_01535 [Actinomycetota bacterium]|nr:hypothetical protein [Actinomycetota bacterium]
MSAAIAHVLPLFVVAIVLQSFLLMGVGLATLVVGLPQIVRTAFELTETEAVVRSLRTVRVAWSSVTDVRRGTWLRGGISLHTASGRQVWAPAPCTWWGGPADDEQVGKVQRWWLAHRGPSPAGPRRTGAQDLRATPSTRYRTGQLARPLAVAGALVAVVNAAALSRPTGGYSFLSMEVKEPRLDHLGWLVGGALLTGFCLGTAATVEACRRLARGSLPRAPVDAPEGPSARPLLLFTAVGLGIATLQWLGLVPAIGSLSMIALGLAGTILGVPLAVAVRRFEQRTLYSVLSTRLVARTFGLECRPLRRQRG